AAITVRALNNLVSADLFVFIVAGLRVVKGLSGILPCRLNVIPFECSLRRRRENHQMQMRCMTVALLFAAGSAGAQNPSVEAHVAAARAAAGEHAGMVDRLCPRETAATSRPGRAPQRGAPPR